MRIDIRGVIVPSDYDVSFLFPYIKKGLITPESYVRNQIAKVDDGIIDLYINSQGGSVFAGNEMINALQDWVAKSKGTLNITVGALAASMGSAILVTLADMATSVKIHSNTKLMFHGAFGGAAGGSEAMKDYSEVLDKINSDIKVKLVSNYNMNPEVVNEWFSEGREGWLTSAEALEIGIADEIVGEVAEAPEEPTGLDGAFNDSGYKIAARALTQFNYKESVMEKLMAKLKSMLGISEDVEEKDVFELLDQVAQIKTDDIKDEVEESESVEDESDDEVEEEVAEEEAEVVEAEVEEVQDLNEACIDMEKELSERDNAIESLQEGLNKKQSENDKLRNDVNSLAERLAKFVGNGINFTVEAEAPTDWKSCLAECDGDYVAARKQFPEVFAKMFK